MKPGIDHALKARAAAVEEYDRKHGTNKWSFPIDRRPRIEPGHLWVSSPGVSPQGVLGGPLAFADLESAGPLPETSSG